MALPRAVGGGVGITPTVPASAAVRDWVTVTAGVSATTGTVTGTWIGTLSVTTDALATALDALTGELSVTTGAALMTTGTLTSTLVVMTAAIAFGRQVEVVTGVNGDDIR